MSVDLRCRDDATATDAVSPREFFSHQLPAALEAHAALLAPGVRQLELAAFSFDIAGDCWSLLCQDGRVTVTAGRKNHAPTVRLNGEDFSGLVRDLYSPMTFFTGGTLDMEHGELGDLLDCWLILRGALDGRPIHIPGDIQFLDKAGQPLDLQRSFGPEDDPADMAWFLEQAGFLHLRQVFTEAEMGQISADMDRAAPTYHDGDGNSWWAETSDGSNRLVRMQRFDQHSPTTMNLLQDRRFLAIAELTGDGHVLSTGDNRIEALVKPLHVVKGISDLPWHKDCALGRHSYDCCGMTVGISVTGADENTGQLRVLAGSNRCLMWPALVASADQHGLPDIALPTQTGDVTVHLSCTMHMAQAPVTAERRVLYTGFRLPERDAAAAARSRQRISQVREGAYTTVSQ